MKKVNSEKKFLAYYGHHKCGSTWISHIIGGICQALDLCYKLEWNDQLFGKDIETLWKMKPFDFLCYTNADYNHVRHLKTLAFHVVRDPRDLIVSAYYSHLYSHGDDWPRIRLYRKYLKSLSKEEGLFKEMEYCMMYYHHLLMWDYCNPYIKEIKFEDMIIQPADSWREVLQFLELYPAIISCEKIEGVIQQFSFQNMSGGRKQGEENHKHHFRKGVSGDWRNHFSLEHIKYFKKLYNPILLKLGYETSENWSY